MVRAYGDCERESYGFVKKAYGLTKSQNLKIINFESNSQLSNVDFEKCYKELIRYGFEYAIEIIACSAGKGSYSFGFEQIDTLRC